MVESEKDAKFLKSGKGQWDKMAEWYAKFEHYAFQGTVTCCTMVDSHQKKRVLEVGCGPGFHSE